MTQIRQTQQAPQDARWLWEQAMVLRFVVTVVEIVQYVQIMKELHSAIQARDSRVYHSVLIHSDFFKHQLHWPSQLNYQRLWVSLGMQYRLH
jgi:hypothetical protein